MTLLVSRDLVTLVLGAMPNVVFAQAVKLPASSGTPQARSFPVYTVEAAIRPHREGAYGCYR